MKLILQVAYCFFSLAGPYVQFPMIFKELRMEGFIVTRWNDRRKEGLQALLKWVMEVRRKEVRCTHTADFIFARSLVIAV